VERGIVIRVEALEWNCPQHITPRFTEAEMDAVLQPLLTENQQLKSQVSSQTTLPSKIVTSATTNVYGEGDLHLVITGVRQLTSKIRAYELKSPDGKSLPKVTAGAHIKVPVQLADGSSSLRHYSLCSNPEQNNHYEIAVLLDEKGKGGSLFVHQYYQIGTHLRCEHPRNDFVLHYEENAIVLIAGGIGITPIIAMARMLKSQGTIFQFHYVGRTLDERGYVESLQNEFSELLNVYTSNEQGLNLIKTMSNVTDTSHFYVCGPERLITGVQQTALQLGIAESRVHVERFSSAVQSNQQPLEVTLKQSRKTLVIDPQQSILEAVENAGINTLSDCKVGNCGICAVNVLEGEPQHFDSVLTERERALGKMCICVSRAKSAKLVLDI
jgi:ferredoxin-NADP reductase